MMADRAPDTCFPQYSQQWLVKDIYLSTHQVSQELQLVGKQLWFTRFQSGNKRRVCLAALQMFKGSIIQHIALITTTQQ